MPSIADFRLGVMYPQYMYISVTSANRYKKLNEKMLGLVDLKNPRSTMPELIELAKDKYRLQSVSVVFAALACEAFIYDFGAEHLGQPYVDDLLDKLDGVAKWVVIPRLATGFEINRRGRAFGSLKNLTRLRNGLIHAKSKAAKLDDPEALAKVLLHEDKRMSTWFPGVENTLELLIEELKTSPKHAQYLDKAARYIAMEMITAKIVKQALDHGATPRG